MNKAVILTGTVCFILGVSSVLLFSPKSENIRQESLMLKEFTSQGRAEIQKMLEDVRSVLEEDGDKIMAEKTRALQAVTAKEINRNKADFYLSGMESEMNKVQKKIDTILFDAIQRMPLMDRKTYMRLYLKNRDFLTSRSVVLPFIINPASDSSVRDPS